MKYAFLLMSGILAAPAFAQTSGGVMSGSGAVLAGEATELPEGASESGENSDGERRICRRIETDSASRMATRRVCLTAREWRDHNRRN